MSRYTGSIKFFNASKGYGFIIPDQQGVQPENVFFHISTLRGTGKTAEDLYDGRRIEFSVQKSDRGQRKECAVDFKFL